MAEFSLLIKEWYRQNKRDLPWRDTVDPYKIWLSEIILQQTRVDQGTSYYLKFINLYPTIKDLANASEQDVLNSWQGLGYYSRARNLHHSAKTVAFNNNGDFPNSFIEIKNLKGVGTYTAAAIASFAFKEPIAVVDGNVYRVLSRVYDIDIPIDSTEGKKLFMDLAQSLIEIKEPDIYNQAIMEFGALQCKPVNPNCEICPLQYKCLAFKSGTIKLRPVKSKKKIVRDRFFHFMIFNHNEHTYLEKRTTKDIWQNMFQFPMIETDEAQELTDFKNHTGSKPIHISREIIHLLSHQRLHARFYHISEMPTNLAPGWIKIKTNQIEDYPLPRLIDRYLEELSGKLFQ